MSTLSVDDSGDPRSHRYYAPRQRRVVAREATLQPVLERLRNGARGYSADERLAVGAEAVGLPQTEFVIVPPRRFPLMALAAFAGGATAVAALAVAYAALATNGGSPVAAVAPSAPSVATAPAKIDARLAPNQPVSRAHAAQPQVAAADGTGAVPADTAKGDRLDAPASPSAGYDPLQSPLSLWSLSPTQAAIEGTDPALAAPGATPATAPPAGPAVAAAPPQHAAPEHHAAPVRHHVRIHHPVRHAHHWRHHRPATTGSAASAGAGQTAGGAASGNAATPPPAKKFLGLFGG